MCLRATELKKDQRPGLTLIREVNTKRTLVMDERHQLQVLSQDQSSRLLKWQTLMIVRYPETLTNRVAKD